MTRCSVKPLRKLPCGILPGLVILAGFAIRQSSAPSSRIVEHRLRWKRSLLSTWIFLQVADRQVPGSDHLEALQDRLSGATRPNPGPLDYKEAVFDERRRISHDCE